MRNTPVPTAGSAQTAPSSKSKPRKPYHAPRMEDYGAVNELTRSNPFPEGSDGPSSYTSLSV